MKNDSARMLSKRTQIVWAAFFFLIPSVLFLLLLGSDNLQGSVLLTKLAPIEERPQDDPIVTAIDSQEKWTSIVIQHLGQPAGSVESVDRSHRQAGLDGLGYHFLIGNGNGLDDGDIQIGYRWLKQQPAARPLGIDSSRWDSGMISICLVGNGNRRPFTNRQLLHVSRLVQRLQQELSIPSSSVFLASELGSDTSSPGQFFAEAQFKGQLLEIPQAK